jgi:hypothetical protein
MSNAMSERPASARPGSEQHHAGFARGMAERSTSRIGRFSDGQAKTIPEGELRTGTFSDGQKDNAGRLPTGTFAEGCDDRTRRRRSPPDR